MKLDMSKFKKISEDPHRAVFRHNDGHSFTVAKTMLSPRMRAELGGMPIYHFDVGGQVPNDSQDNQAAPESSGQTQQPINLTINNTPPPQQQQPDASWAQQAGGAVRSGLGAALPAVGGFLKDRLVGGINQMTAGAAPAIDFTKGLIGRAPGESLIPGPAAAQQPMWDEAPGGPKAPNEGATNVPTGSPDPYGYDSYLKAHNAETNAQIGGINAEAAAQGQKGQQETQALQQALPQMQKNLQTFEQQTAKLNQEREGLMQDYQNGHVDPNHLYASMSTAGKFATGIGLILGGMGGGLTHQENPALKFLSQQIDRDIDAQKANLGKTKSLLDANMQQFGNLRDATSATRIMMGDIVSNQLAQAAAQSQDPIAKARAQQAIAQIKDRQAAEQQQLAMRQSVLGNVSGGGVSPEQRISMLASSPQEAQAAGKELQSAKNHATQQDKILAAFNQASQENTLAGRVGRAGFEPPSVGVFQALMMPYLKDAEGRINESELQRTDKLIPKVGDKEATIQEKLNGLKSFLQEKAPVAVTLPKFGIDPHQFGTRNSEGNKKIQLGPPVK